MVFIDVEGWRHELMLLHYFYLSNLVYLRHLGFLLICCREGLNNLQVVAVWRAFLPIMSSIIAARGNCRIALVALPMRVGCLFFDPDGCTGIFIPRLRIVRDSRDWI